MNSKIEIPLVTTVNRAIVATCNLNNWALDFDGNLFRIIESIKQAKSKGARYRLGPELEVSGYSCEDHFLELDTYLHCDQSLAAILSSDLTDDIICDIGCPILHKNVRYNCRVLCLNRKILFIRPKIAMADDGNYRETRFFSTWKNKHETADHDLPDIISKVTGQKSVKFGYFVLKTSDTMIASEICEELWVPNSPHIEYALAGVEIFTNGSGSHHQLRKLDVRLSLIKNAMNKSGGVYLYSNLQGCDGNRLYFDGSSLICVNGELVSQASQFSMNDVEVLTAVVDLDHVRSHRQGSKSFQELSSESPHFPTYPLPEFRLCLDTTDYLKKKIGQSPCPTQKIKPCIHSPEEECALGPACWLWDYLRRSGASGFLLPLSGGADSASVASIVRVMCELAVSSAYYHDEDHKELRVKSKEISAQIDKFIDSSDGNKFEESVASRILIQTQKRVNKTLGVSLKDLTDELCNTLLHSIYMGTSNSSSITQDRAYRLSEQIKCYHTSINIDTVISSIVTLFSGVFGKTPNYQVKGGTMVEDLALQNIQARIRMVFAYLCAQLYPWLRGKRGFLLVLGSSNVDEALRGYMTKYDCSSADLNPIGGICKGDLKNMLLWSAETYSCPVLSEIALAKPSAELRPIEGKERGDNDGDGDGDHQEYSQLDEDEMGMTYQELGVFGYLRKVLRCGPVTMFIKLVDIWSHISPVIVAEKVKRFFYYYALNRHKMTVLTPSYHAENYSPDDNRFDLRQFLYNLKWTRQFNTIDKYVDSCESSSVS